MAKRNKGTEAVEVANSTIDHGLRRFRTIQGVAPKRLDEIIQIAQRGRPVTGLIKSTMETEFAVASDGAAMAANAALKQSAKKLGMSVTQADERALAAMTRGFVSGKKAIPGMPQWDGLDGLSRRAAGKVSGEITRGLRAGKSIDEIAEAVAPTLNLTVKQARAVVDTAVTSAYRASQVNIAIREGNKRLVYAGPEDGMNRKFCKKRVGKSFTISQINRMNNGQGLSVITSCGGWNCRHAWVPK